MLESAFFIPVFSLFEPLFKSSNLCGIDRVVHAGDIHGWVSWSSHGDSGQKEVRICAASTAGPMQVVFMDGSRGQATGIRGKWLKKFESRRSSHRDSENEWWREIK